MRISNIKKVQRNKKNIISLIIVVVLVIITIIIVITKNTSSTIEQDFHFADTEAITKIIIQDKENHKIELSKKEDSIWLVNSKYEANKVLVDIVLSTFKNMRIREPLPKASRNNVVKDIATIGKQIDIYTIDYKIRFWFIKLFKEERKAVTYFVGSETPDEMGTYMLKKGDNQPYVIYIPNFRGYLSTRFSVTQDAWRTHNVFKYKQNEIESISVELPESTHENYTLINNGNGFSFVTADGTTLSEFDTNKVLAFLSSFVEMNYEHIAKDIPQIEKDTIFTKQPSFIVTVKDKKGIKHNLKTFVKLIDPESIAKDDEDIYNIFDINRCYAISDKYKDTLIMQFFTLDNVLKPASYFFIGAEGHPYIK